MSAREWSCATCGEAIKVDESGQMIEHQYNGVPCEGSGVKVLPYQRDDSRVEASVYKKNRRFTVEKGTREVTVTMSVPFRGNRDRIEREARKLALITWRKEFGRLDFDYDLVELVTWHLTAQVLVALRVYP